MSRPAASRAPAIPPWLMACAAMMSVQLGNALSTFIGAQVGAGGATWLRSTFGALMIVAIARPSLKRVRRADMPVLLGLGAATACMSLGFLAALERIPLGTAVEIEFLGPLLVAAIRSGSLKRLIWPALALVGVLILTDPWQGGADPIGVLLAAGAGAAWGSYILLTQAVGDRYEGLDGLAITLPIAAVVTAFVGVPEAWGHLDLGIVAAAAGLAVLMPALPFSLEMLALKRMTPTAFGTLMALEPAFGLIIGALVLGQMPAPLQLLGIVLVVVAGAMAQLGGRRDAGATATVEAQAAAARAPEGGILPLEEPDETHDDVPDDPTSRTTRG